MGFNSQTGARSLTLTGTNTGNNTLSAVVGDSGGATSLNKNGSGTWLLTSTSGYTGATTVTAGTLVVSGGLSATASVAVNNTGSTLQLGANSAINSTATLSLNSGTLDVNGHAQTMGALTTLSGSSRILLDLSTGSSLTLANSSSGAWSGTLTIEGWDAVSFGGTGLNHIFFGASGLTSGQIADITFLNPTIGGSTQTGSYTATLLGSGEIVAVPEPGTFGVVFFGLISLIGCQWLRKRQVGA